jgi:hypothetical protein
LWAQPAIGGGQDNYAHPSLRAGNWELLLVWLLSDNMLQVIWALVGLDARTSVAMQLFMQSWLSMGLHLGRSHWRRWVNAFTPASQHPYCQLRGTVGIPPRYYGMYSRGPIMWMLHTSFRRSGLPRSACTASWRRAQAVRPPGVHRLRLSSRAEVLRCLPTAPGSARAPVT